jgi:hypothetical protein
MCVWCVCYVCVRVCVCVHACVLCVCVHVCVCYVCVCAHVFFHVHNITGDLNLLVPTFMRCIFTADTRTTAGLTRNTWTPNSRQRTQIAELIKIVSFFPKQVQLCPSRESVKSADTARFAPETRKSFSPCLDLL